MSLAKSVLAKAVSSTHSHSATIQPPHVKDLLPQRQFEKQQPIINELVARFEKLQNKRESFRNAAQRPALPRTPIASQPKQLLRPSKVLEIDVSPAPQDSKSSAESEVPIKKTRPVLTMEDALMDVKLRGHFREFVEAAYATENLDFFEAVEKYETITNEKERAQFAMKIVDNYVRVTAPNQVNLPSSVASKLVIAVDGKADASKLLGQAKHEILDLMQTNFFDKFLSVVGQPAFVPDDESDEEKDLDSTEKKKYFKEWVKRVHPKTGDVYFENPQTGVTMWDVPKPIGLVPPPIEPPPYF